MSDVAVREIQGNCLCKIVPVLDREVACLEEERVDSHLGDIELVEGTEGHLAVFQVKYAVGG